MNEISLFLIGLFFGFCSGVAIMSLRRTTRDVEEQRHVVEQLQIRDEMIAQQRQIIKSLQRGQK